MWVKCTYLVFMKRITDHVAKILLFPLDVLDENNFAPVEGEGANGKPVIISQREVLKMQQQFAINRFNLLASDRIPLNRTLPDVRKKK